ncbi:MAG: hypothetical protein IH613_12095 [Desulfuromonadales bacterium]|nr:hypothetical protein [Desulfuromonadales bacterium]
MDAGNLTGSCTYQIDAQDRIDYVGGDWVAFARANQAAASCFPDQVIGRPLWDFIDGMETRHLYHVVLKKVRSLQLAVKLPFRCDAPDRRRFLELLITPVSPDRLQFMSTLLREELRDPLAILLVDAQRSEELIKMCSMCKRIETPLDTCWSEVEEALAALAVFNADRVPQITHGICPDCLLQARKTLFDLPGKKP